MGLDDWISNYRLARLSPEIRNGPNPRDLTSAGWASQCHYIEDFVGNTVYFCMQFPYMVQYLHACGIQNAHQECPTRLSAILGRIIFL